MSARPRGKVARSQELWTRGEALERAGRAREAAALYARAALAEEEAGRPLRARLVWEQVAGKAGATGTVLERLALASERAHLFEEAFDYWAASAVRYHEEGRSEDASRARAHAARHAPKVGPHEKPPLAEKVLSQAAAAFVADLVPG